MTWDVHTLGNRGILRGVQCACGQWWPDFVRTEEHALRFRTECCGAVYQLSTGVGMLSTLSLVPRPGEVVPVVPEYDQAQQAERHAAACERMGVVS